MGLITEFKANKQELTTNPDKGVTFLLTQTFNMVEQELMMLEKESCRSCSGFGHTADRCPTGVKLGNLVRVGGCNAEVISLVKNFIDGERYHARFGIKSSTTLRYELPKKKKLPPVPLVPDLLADASTGDMSL